MNQTTSNISANLADECKRLRARVNQLEGMLEHSESENGELYDRLQVLRKEHEKLKLDVRSLLGPIRAAFSRLPWERLADDIKMFPDTWDNEKLYVGLTTGEVREIMRVLDALKD